jgi:26S proteasome regulatory subunit N6
MCISANDAARTDGTELQQDPLIRSHLSVLYDTLLEQNLVRVIEPYSAVELSWIAQEVGQSLTVVEEK